MRKKILIFFIVLALVLQSKPYYDHVMGIKDNLKIIFDYYRGKDTIRNGPGYLEPLIAKAQKVIPNSNQIKYLYIDQNDITGTMNYYKMRYYLAPRKNVYWNLYAFDNIYTDKKYLDIIDKYKVNYIIVYKNDQFLKLIGKDIKGNENVIFKVNDKIASKDLKSIISLEEN